jgi:hypothetical protein
MEEILNCAGTCLRVVLAVVFFVTPGMAFWLVVASLVAAVRRFRHSDLYLNLRNRVGATASLSS